MDVNKDADRSNRFSRRTMAWVIGCAALLGATSAAGVASNNPPRRPKPAAATSSGKNALDSILLKNPKVGQPVSDLIRAGLLPKPTYSGDTGAIGVPAGTALPNLPAGAVTRFVPGAINGDFNLLQLAALALSVGCPASAAPIAAAIAAAESGGNPGAQGDISLMDGTWDWSQGLWQIRGLRSERGTGELRDSLANANPVTNAHAMYIISSGCTDWTPWSTYNTGAYLAYMGLSKNAVLAAQQYRSRTGSYPPVGPGQAVAVPASSSSSSAGRSRRSGKPSRKPGSSGKSSGPRSGQSPARSGGGAPAGAQNPARSSNAPANPAPAPTTAKPKLPLPTSSVPVKLPPPPSKKPSLPVPTSALPKLPKPSVSVP